MQPLIFNFGSNDIIISALALHQQTNAAWNLSVGNGIVASQISPIRPGIILRKDQEFNLLPTFLVSDNKILSMILTHLSSANSAAEAISIMSILAARQPYLFREET